MNTNNTKTINIETINTKTNNTKTINTETINTDTINIETINNVDNENYGVSYCTVYKIRINFGIDKNSMVHCQYCHNIWDGFAQCTCNLDYKLEDD